LIELEAGVVVDVEAVPGNRTQELETTNAMVKPGPQLFGVKPRRHLCDTA